MAQNLSQPSGWKGSTVTDPTRPRVYTGFFDGSNEAERQFLAALPKVTKFINDRLKAGGYAFDVHQAEIATNFIGEGGYYPLHWNYWQHIDGFGALGIDTFVQRRQALKRWVPDSVMKLADDPHHVGKTLNEKRETVTFLTDLDMEQGLYANAGMFALCIATAANDIPGFAQLPRKVRFFWATVYYNSGEGKGRSLLKQHGVDYYKTPWKGPENMMSPLFNALWRMRTMETLLQALWPGTDRPPPAAPSSNPDPASSEKDPNS